MKKIMKKTSDNGLKVGQILGINVNSTTTSSVLARVKGFVADSKQFSIVTPNPELILMAQDNKDLKNALNSADFSIPDGVGLKLADSKLNIIKGRELFLELIKLASKNSWKVFFLGGMGDEAAVAKSKIGNSIIIESNKGPTLDKNSNPATDADKKLELEAIGQINKFKPQLLFVAFGNPKQEIWIHKNLSRLNVGGAMAVGGTFRYIAGMSKLPPKWMAKYGLEWLWRLVTEPVRIGRILRAVVVFPLKIWMSKLH